MYPKKCADCGGIVKESNATLSFDVRGETVFVEGIPSARCVNCGEVCLTLDDAEKLQAEAIRISKVAKGLLSPDEIKKLRISLSLSQAKFEKLLGVGEKTVIRWEKGTVFQSATADRLMRLIQHRPELVDLLLSGELYPSPFEIVRAKTKPTLARKAQHQ